MTPITGSSPSRPADRAELHRIATALARAEGWDAAGPPTDDPGGGVSLPVTGAALHRRARLRVRERRAGEAGPSADRELAARRRAASEHVVGLVQEVGRRQVRGREMDAVLLADAPGGTLAELIARRSGVSGGEAATVLLGVARGIAALHAAGWAAPTLSPEGVEFTADGCPSLGLLDGVVPLHPEAAVADAEAFHAFARSLCLRVVDGTGMRLLAAVEGALRSGRWSAVEEAVAAVARPVAVRSAVEGEVPSVGVSVNAPGAVDAGDSARAVARAHPSGDDRGRAPRLASVVELFDDRPLQRVGTRLLAALRRRPALALVAAVPVIVGLAVVALVPGTPAPSAAVSRSTAASTPSVGRSTAAWGRSGATGTPVAGSGAASLAAEAGDGGAGAGASPEGEKPRGDSDDPVDAAVTLLDARHACFSATSAAPACLDDVLEAGAALQGDEAAALGGAGAADERDYAGAQLSLVERWGDAALVAVVPDAARTPKSRPASLLLVRSEAGWRLRAVFP
ncbi:hypothetical protein [Leifsonia virtsii]|uniref:Protein kinase domain-containing protein n=1 Tax=Leifsonia virtsii TaxID=3035915 RepID=A0ABT8IV24_9MICO|nr:hypothetical protein [Leifsonia virtsii]MDN4595919.1 hypothetical protein [Leifsonia virtsii]